MPTWCLFTCFSMMMKATSLVSVFMEFFAFICPKGSSLKVLQSKLYWRKTWQLHQSFFRKPPKIFQRIFFNAWNILFSSVATGEAFSMYQTTPKPTLIIVILINALQPAVCTSREIGKSSNVLFLAAAFFFFHPSKRVLYVSLTLACK